MIQKEGQLESRVLETAGLDQMLTRAPFATRSWN